MKETQIPTPGMLSGIEHNGEICDGNSGGLMLNYIEPAFIHISDAYYNSYPRGSRYPPLGEWENPSPGVHRTESPADVIRLLDYKDSKDIPNCKITRRALEKLVQIGQTVRLLRSRTHVTTQYTEVMVTHSPLGREERIVEDTIETRTIKIGKWTP